VRLPSRVALLIAAALGVFAGVVAIQLYRMEIARASCARPRAEVPAERPPAAILAAAGSPAERGVAASRSVPVEPPRPSRSPLTIRLEFGVIDVNVLQRAAFHLTMLGSDDVLGSVRGWATRGGEGSVYPDSLDASSVTSLELARTDLRVSGLPPGPVRALAVLQVDRTVIGIAGPISIGADVIEATLDVVPADRLGSVVADVRRDGSAFGPATVVVRAGGLVVGSLHGVRGRGASIPAPVGIPLEVSLADTPGSEELGLPPPRELTLAPRETRDVVFALDDGVPFTIRAIGPDGGALAFRALVFRDPEGRGPRPAPGLLLTYGITMEHAGRGPVGELSVLVIPMRTGAPTWARASLAGRTVVPIDVRVGLEGAVLDLRLGDDAGSRRGGWHVAMTRTDATDLGSFATWSGDVLAGGRVVSPPLPPGSYLLELGGRYVRTVTLPAEGLALTLAAPAHPSRADLGPVLDVSTSDAAGQLRTVAGAYVLPEGDGWGQRLEPRRGEPGRFEAAVLSAGRFRVVVPWTWGAGPRHGAVEVPVTLLGEGVFPVDVVVPPP